MSSYWGRKAQPYTFSGSKGKYYNKGKRTSFTPPTPPPPLGPLISSIRVSDLDDASTQYQHSATIEECEPVASYNWMGTDLEKPDILIPGKHSCLFFSSLPPAISSRGGHHHSDLKAPITCTNTCTNTNTHF